MKNKKRIVTQNLIMRTNLCQVTKMKIKVHHSINVISKNKILTSME